MLYIYVKCKFYDILIQICNFQVRTMPVDWHGVRHTVVTYSNVDEMALLERMLQGSRELIPHDMTPKKMYLF